MSAGIVPVRPRRVARVDGRVRHIDGQLHRDGRSFLDGVVPKRAGADELVGGEVVEGYLNVGELEGKVGGGCVG